MDRNDNKQRSTKSAETEKRNNENTTARQLKYCGHIKSHNNK